MWTPITIAVICIFVFAIINQFRKCNHQWDKVVDKEYESPIANAGLKSLNNCRDSDILKRTSIIILVCTECGTVNKTITRV